LWSLTDVNRTPGDVRRQIQGLGRQRAGNHATIAARQREHALGGIAVEFDIDIRQRNHAAANRALRPQRETPEAAERNLAIAGPAHGLAQRRRLDAEHALKLECRLRAGGTVEREIERRAGDAQLDAGALTGQRREKIAERQARLDRLVVPHEMTVSAEAARDRRPGELELHSIEPLDVTSFGIAHDDGAVVDTDLGKRPGARRIRRKRPRQRCRKPRPIRLAAGREGDGDRRPHQRHIGDFDVAGEQREITQPRGQFLGHNGGLAGPIVAQQHIVKAHGSRREQ
jgi:hypothetical protein